MSVPEPVRNYLGVQGVTCDEPGATIATLPVEEGYWRAARTVTFIRECPNPVNSSNLIHIVSQYSSDGRTPWCLWNPWAQTGFTSVLVCGEVGAARELVVLSFLRRLQR